jgi:hypothetical protein
MIQVSELGSLINQAPLCFFYFSNSYYDKIKIKMFLGKRPKGYYQKAYKILIEAKKKSLKQHDDAERSTLEIKKGFLEFLNFLEKIISSPKLKYSDISSFVVLDDKFIFPQESNDFYYTLDEYGATLQIKTKGLLFELIRALNLEQFEYLIGKLEDELSNLHEALSLNRREEIGEKRNKVLEVISEFKNIIEQTK